MPKVFLFSILAFLNFCALFYAIDVCILLVNMYFKSISLLIMLMTTNQKLQNYFKGVITYHHVATFSFLHSQ